MNINRKAIVGLFLCGTMILTGCIKSGKDKVLVIEKTKSYHTEKCSRVFMAYTKSAMREEARSRHYTACPDCKPDKGK